MEGDFNKAETAQKARCYPQKASTSLLRDRRKKLRSIAGYMVQFYNDILEADIAQRNHTTGN